MTNCPSKYEYKNHTHTTTKSWMNHLLDFCSIQEVTLRRKCNPFSFNSKNDRNLMESFVNCGFHGHQLTTVNRYQLYLQVIHLSDIITGDGTRISKAAYNGVIDRWSMSQHEWPNQGRPGNHDRVDWRRAINSCFSVSLPTIILPLSYQPTTWDENIPNKF